MEDSKESLEGGEICLAHRDDVAHMHELSVEALCLLQGVCPASVPGCNGGKILGFLVFGDGNCSVVDVPKKPNVWNGGGKCDVFGPFPWDAQLV
jgi:hypothetical protein